MPVIQNLRAIEILDSRGRPTIYAECRLANGITGAASVPSGASKGKSEAVELRDGDQARYGGLGCRAAVNNINGQLNSALKDRAFVTQADLDQTLIHLDGTPDKSRLGANCILAVSLAFARAAAAEQKQPLFRYFAALAGESNLTLPRLTINLFSGGKHAGSQVAIQDVLLVPVSARTIDEALAQTYAVYRSAVALVKQKYQMRALTADEGGLAPPFPDEQAMFDDAVEAIIRAGLQPERDFALAVDVASSHFYNGEIYELGGKRFTGAEMVDQLTDWASRYPLISIEDGLAEEDWNHWALLRSQLRRDCIVLGDDLLCTNPRRIKEAVQRHAADALLLKLNQIGTLTEALVSLRLARDAGWQVIVSARSGETEDNWLADLAVGWKADFIKIGSITQSERLAKYNRLLQIEAETRIPLANSG